MADAQGLGTQLYWCSGSEEEDTYIWQMLKGLATQVSWSSGSEEEDTYRFSLGMRVERLGYRV